MKIPKKEYTSEFKELAAQRVLAGKGLLAVARELGLPNQTLHNWVKAAKTGKLNKAGGKVVTEEQMELSRLRTENIRLQRQLEILKKATAFFAKDAL